MKEAAAQHVIYVHGLWMPGGESRLLAHRLLREFGLQVHAFPYSAATLGMEEITTQLQGFVRSLDVPAVHFVGHSLGGLVIYRFFERYPGHLPGRAVFLGTPCLESRAAVRAGQLRFVSALMGPSVADELLRPRQRRWTFGRALGIIAGTQSVGLGQFLAGFEEDCDGTVAVSETRLPGAADHITLPVSHMGMLVSPRVARETGLFLTNGRFSLR
ncbi:MAG: alpha/beta hydrolase [Gammaproteobacteria bacterium]|nr:alpha/beta hydrolase [Gammaproteobacteria bacterium]